MSARNVGFRWTWRPWTTSSILADECDAEMYENPSDSHWDSISATAKPPVAQVNVEPAACVTLVHTPLTWVQ